MIISPKRFWQAIERGARRPTEPPSWLSEHFRSHVSIGLRHVPGSPDYRPRRQDHEDPEAAR